jgi:hypothetical protein
MANATQPTPIEAFKALKEQLINELADVEIEMDNARMVFDEKMVELTGRKDFLREALFGEVQPVVKTAAYNPPAVQEKVTKKAAPKRRIAKKTAPKSRVTKKKVAPKVVPATNSNAEQLLAVVKDNPGSSKQDLRRLLPGLTERQLSIAVSHCSKKHLIENRGSSKARPEWFAIG